MSENACPCTKCNPATFFPRVFTGCPKCGNKRCPKGVDHDNDCTGSNEVGQVATRTGVDWQPPAMTPPAPPSATPRTALSAAIALAAHPENDAARYDLGMNVIPHLRFGENIDNGSMRILSGAIEDLEKQLDQERQDRVQAEKDVCRALGERNDARAELDQIKAVLADPNAVRLNMLRGTIAYTPEILRHVLGDDGSARAEADRLAAVDLRSVLIALAADMLMTGEMPPEDASDWKFSKSTTLRDKVRVISHARRSREQCRKWAIRLRELADSLPPQVSR